MNIYKTYIASPNSLYSFSGFFHRLTLKCQSIKNKKFIEVIYILQIILMIHVIA